MRDPADLHLHTNHSDGLHSPGKVVRLAAEAGVRTLAVADHDTISALPEARRAAERLGLELIPAVEIGVQHGGVDVHLLAYHIDPDHPELHALLDQLRQARTERLARMIERLQALGLPVTLPEVRRLARRGGPVGRPHLAKALARRRWIATTEDAFRFFIGSEGPAYLPNQTPPPEQVLRVIMAAGGIPVLAHPISYRWETLLERFLKAGLMGLEVHHPRHDAAFTAGMRALAAERGLLETGGSDYHGLGKGEAPPGSVRPPRGAVARLEAARIRVPEVLRSLNECTNA